VNGDIVDAGSARAALAQSGADAVMIGRGAYGRPWIASAIEAALRDGGDAKEPAPAARLAIVLEHFADSLRFYGDRLGVKIFRKHLGWYVENAPLPACAAARREAKAWLCRMTDPREIETTLTALWRDTELPLAA
ncbi:MAG TPA: tRNA-dihydrouridine synthase, partial [Rhizomicrobium sp.]